MSMDPDLFKKWHAEGLITDNALHKVQTVENNRLFSLHWELKTLLYLGIVLLSGGLGVLVYKNIDSIGHQAVLAFIALVCAGCYFYCFRSKNPWSPGKVQPPNPFFDYVLLLGCLAMITFVGYLQFQYSLFGKGYGLVTFIPMVILFASAYYFDHLGILSLAITNLAAWMGISVTPLTILKENDFSNEHLIYTGLGLGLVLVLAGWVTERRKFKEHFSFTYANFGTHILFISGLAGLFLADRLYIGWFLLLLGMTVYFFRKARREGSFYFILIVILYAYIALSYVVVHILVKMSNFDFGIVYVLFLYFILSAIGILRLLIILNRKMKTHDSI